MDVYFITFRSVTYAQRAERLLEGQGIRCSLQRTPKWMEQQGCGYSIRLGGGSLPRALELMKEYRLPMRQLYRQEPDGHMEELPI